MSIPLKGITSGIGVDSDANGIFVNVKAGTVTIIDGGGSLTVDNTGTFAVQAAVSNFPVSQPVTGTFFQATQPVSIAASVPVTGTFFQVTQPISATSLPLPTGAALDVTQTNGNQKSQLVNPTGIATDVTTKGTQATNYLATQEPKDTGRTKIILSANKVTGVTSEALLTLTIKKGTAVTTTGTSYTVTAGKILRIESIFLGMTNVTTAAVTNVAVRVREGAAAGGAVAVTSDIVAIAETGNSVATLQSSGQTAIGFPDGQEITAGQNIGVSQLAQSVNLQLTLVIVAFEY